MVLGLYTGSGVGGLGARGVPSSPALPSGSARGAMGREHRTLPRSRSEPLNLQK